MSEAAYQKNTDTVIIGGGLGGLAAGARLARSGKTVLLLEQHSRVGGYAAVFESGGYRFEASLYEMDGLNEGDIKREIFAETGISDKLEFIPVPEFYRAVTAESDIVIPHDMDRAADILIEAFPHEASGIRKFYKTIKAISGEVRRLPVKRWRLFLSLPFFPLLYPLVSLITCRKVSLLFPLFMLMRYEYLRVDLRSVGHFVDSIMTDEELKGVLLANIGFYHSDPYSLSLLFYSMGQSGFHAGGGHYIKGGSASLAAALSGVIRENGGIVLTGASAVGIGTDKGRITGVEFVTGGDEEGARQRVKANNIVFNAAPPLIKGMIYGKEKERLNLISEQKTLSASMLSVHLGFSSSTAYPGNKAYCTIICGKRMTASGDQSQDDCRSYEEPSLWFIDYSMIDSGLVSGGRSTGAIVIEDSFADWSGLSAEEYNARKQSAAEILIRRLNEVLPGIRDRIDYIDVSTPVTLERYTRNPGGVINGYAQIPEQAGVNRLPNRSPVRGLYFASAWSRPGGSFTGALTSGWLAAGEILGVKTGRYG